MQDNQRQTHWAYAAGIFDADGCFMISRHKRETKRKNYPHKVDQWSWTYLPAVKVSMVEPEAINLLHKILGFGTVSLNGARPSRPNSKPLLQWGIRNRTNLPVFLEQIIPYLRIKKNRAKFLLEYCKTAKRFGGWKSGYFGLGKEELNYREESYQKMRKLNGSKVAAETKPLKHESVNDSPNIIERL